MTLEEARAELGVEAGADAETVRRAYLRVIKTRKPETDPEGFKRAREAFEIARDEGQLEAFAHRFTGAGSAASAQGAGAEAAPGAAPDAGGPAAKSREDIIFEGFMAAWQSIPRSDNPRKRLEIAREAVAALPSDRRAYWMVVQSLTRLAPESELAEALRAGHQAGFPEFLETLLVRTPRLAQREEVDAALASPDTSLRLAGAAVGARWDPERTAAVVVEMCAAAGADPEALPIADMLDVILALQQANAVAPAARAQQALRDLLRDHGLELPLVHGPLGGVWTLAEELASLPPGFPHGLREAFAVATRAGDLQTAFFDTCEVIDRDRGEVEMWAAKLTGATNVVNTMREALRWRAAQQREAWRFRVSPALVWVAVPLLLVMLRNCADRPSYTPPISRVSEPTTTVYARPAPSLAPSSPQGDMIRSAGVVLCGSDWRQTARLPCGDIQELGWALDAGDCERSERVLRALHDLVRLKPHTVREEERRLLTTAQLARWQVCSGKP